MRELARLQTFPDDVNVEGSYRAIQRQIGNAAPSLLAEVIGRAVRTQLLGLEAIQGDPQLLPPVRRHVPAPEPVLPVPEQYEPLRGKHAAHPGTGKGFRAQAWAGLAE
jgi:DNA (cytosine-5)-methyltransferase 1